MYNGYTNYETWCISLWINNDEYLYEYCKNLSASELKETVEDLAENDLERVENGFIADLVHASLSEVNWEEITEEDEE